MAKKQKTLNAEVITLYRVYERNEWGEAYEWFYRTEKKARDSFSGIVDSYKNAKGYFNEEGTLRVGDYDDYDEAVREAKKAAKCDNDCECPNGSAADIPPWDELAKQNGCLICERLISDIEMYWEKVTAVKLADGTIHRLEKVSIDK